MVSGSGKPQPLTPTLPLPGRGGKDRTFPAAACAEASLSHSGADITTTIEAPHAFVALRAERRGGAARQLHQVCE